MKINLDLHIHSKYSAATSERMGLSEIAREAGKKGISIVATGDCLHSRWLAEVASLPAEGGLFQLGKTRFVLTTEVEDCDRVHHLILVPDISKARQLREVLAGKASNLDSDGRPNLRMSGPEIADASLDAECLIGPSHAFTPWTGAYAHHRSLEECYGDRSSHIRFVELGLSADSDYADRISELHSRTFLTNSDAHSPWSDKLGREFNQMEFEDLSFEEIARAICRQGGRRMTLNVGFFPEEGKYNRTACTRCYKHYTSRQMDDLLGRCACGGLIKLGVRDRVMMLADLPEAAHPDHRPPYLHLIPLAEIIAMALGHKSIHTAGVMRTWEELVSVRSEIEVLLEAELDDLDIDGRVKNAIQAFRSGKVVVDPGGGGRYGRVSLPEACAPPEGGSQRSLFDF